VVTENTLLSFGTALEDGADGIEFDVRLNHEGACIVFHDETLDRMTEGGDPREVFVVSAHELTKLALNRGGTIPLLQEVLRWANSRDLFLNIELKPRLDDARRLAANVMQEIRTYAEFRLQSRILVSSFSPDVIAYAIEQQWQLPTAFLTGPNNPLLPPCVGIERFGVHPHFSLMTPSQWAVFRQAGSFINVWTVNECSVAEELNSLQVDGLVTDDPRKMRDLFE
jgi:glycerophosphoryl diester phosphodiesterase